MFQLVVHQWYQWCHWFSQQSEKKTQNDCYAWLVKIWATIDLNDRASGNFEKSIACRKHYHMQWAHFCRECHISFSFSFSIYSISMCNFRPFLGLSLHFKVCRRKDAQTNSKKTNLLKSFFFSTFFRLAWWHCFLACTCVWNVSSIFACDFRMVLVVYVPFLVKKK